MLAVPALELAFHITQSCCLVPGRGVTIIWMRKNHIKKFTSSDSICHHMSLVTNPNESVSLDLVMDYGTNHMLRAGFSNSQESSGFCLMRSVSTVARYAENPVRSKVGLLLLSRASRATDLTPAKQVRSWSQCCTSRRSKALTVCRNHHVCRCRYIIVEKNGRHVDIILDNS